MTHGASINLVCSSAFSNIAKVVFGLRSCLVTRMATRSPTRPMRPSVRTTLPPRTETSASARISSGRVSPTFSFISCFSGISASYSTASTAISACATSVAKWPSQIGSRPNFSPMNICNSTGLLGVGQHDLDQPLDQIGFDRGVGPALDPHRGLAAAAAEQHVDDRIDQAGIDGSEAEIFPL